MNEESKNGSPENQPFAWLDAAREERMRQGLWRTCVTRESPPVAGQIHIDGRPYINFSSNDYLGLAGDGRLVDAARHAAGQVGVGTGASPLVTGRGTLHRRLEQELATFLDAPAAMLFPTGFAANVGAITSLVGRGDHIYADALNHASLIDGCRLSGARAHHYRHADVAHLEQLIQMTGSTGRRLIVTDSVFSMDGDVAPIEQIMDVARRYGCMVLIDEAHALGVLGPEGRGISAQAGVNGAAVVRTATMSKALGAHGGFVVASTSVVDWLRNSARSYMFSTAAPEMVCAAALEALRIVQREPHRRERLLTSATWFRQTLKQHGIEIGNSTTHIVPAIIGSNETAMGIAESLRAHGIWAPAIRPPAVPDRTARIRFSLSSEHAASDLEKTVAAISQAMSKS